MVNGKTMNAKSTRREFLGAATMAAGGMLGGWGETVNGAAAFMELEKAGFDQMPCTSNWAEDAAADALVAYCRGHIDPSRLKGFYTAPWARIEPDSENKRGVGKVIEGIDLFAAARDRHYGGFR